MQNLNLSKINFLQFHLIQLSFIFLLISQGSYLHGQCFYSETFDTPGQFNYTIPTASANYIIEIEARGGDGGDFLWGTLPQTNGGEGATMKGSFLVPASSELLIQIGNSGFDGVGDPAGGGGGGGTAVIIDNSEVLIAAAAGGGGGQGDPGYGGLANANSSAQGGAALGASGGGGFNENGANGDSGTGGGAGALFNIGSGGSGGLDAGGGGAGFGGGGGGSEFSGGGGGGYRGGDGAMSSGDQGGHGGDSFINSLFSGSLISATAGNDEAGNNIDGFVTIICIPISNVNLTLVNSQSPLCFDGFDGSIEVMATDGLAPYMYALNGGLFGSENVFTGLSSGNYTVTVLDGLGNTSTVNVTLDNPTELVNTFLGSTDNICFGAFEGVIAVDGSGGTTTGDYTFSINGGAEQSTGLFTGLPNGFYVVSVFDDNSCSTQVTANITSPPEMSLIVTNIQPVSCSGNTDGSMLVFVTGGVPNYLYALDDGDFDVFASFSSLAAGLHTISVIDSNGCLMMESFTIPEPDPIEILADVTNVNCAGDSTGIIVIDVTGGNSGYQFSFDGQQEDTVGIYNNLIAGTYSVQVTDVNECTAVLEVNVSESSPLNLISTTNMPAACGGEGEIIFDLVGAQGYAIYSVDGNVGASDTFNLPAGIYLAAACDSLGCVASLEFEIDQLSDISIDVENKVDVSCFGGDDGFVSISSIGEEGDILYTLDGGMPSGSAIFDNLSSGDYIISATDSLGCSASLSITISEPEPLNIEILSILDVACFGDNTGSVSFDVTGGNTPYELTTLDGGIIVEDSTYSILDVGEGDLVITVFDSLGCTSEKDVYVEENQPLQLSIDSVASVNCADGTMGFVSLSATGGAPLYSFEQDGNLSNGIFENLSSDIYAIEVEDSVGCVSSIEVNIGMVGSLIVAGTESSDVSCSGGDDGSYSLYIPNHIGELNWTINGVSNPDSAFVNLSAGQYTINAVDSLECLVELEVNINQPNELNAEVVNFDVGNGTNGTITVLVDGGTEPYMYSIDDKVTFQDSAVFVNLIPNDYTVTIVDANGCEIVVTQIISDVDNTVFESLIISPNPAFNILNISLNNGGVQPMKLEVLDLNGRVINTFLPSKIQQSTTIDIQELSSGTYFIKITNGDAFVVKRFVKI